MTKNGAFLIKSIYKALDTSPNVSLPWPMVWMSCVQPKFCFFTWKAAWDKVLSLDQL